MHIGEGGVGMRSGGEWGRRRQDIGLGRAKSSRGGDVCDQRARILEISSPKTTQQQGSDYCDGMEQDAEMYAEKKYICTDTSSCSVVSPCDNHVFESSHGIGMRDTRTDIDDSARMQSSSWKFAPEVGASALPCANVRSARMQFSHDMRDTRTDSDHGARMHSSSFKLDEARDDVVGMHMNRDLGEEGVHAGSVPTRTEDTNCSESVPCSDSDRERRAQL
jgi:hypothetical protein